MYELVNTCEHGDCLTDVLREKATILCKYAGFDNWKIIMFNKDKLYGFLLLSSKDKKGCSGAGSKKVYFDRYGQKSFMNLLLDEMKPMFYWHEDNTVPHHDPLSRDAMVELYYPLVSVTDSKKEVVGCLYFSKSTHPKTAIKECLDSDVFTLGIRDIQWLFEVVYKEYIENGRLFDLIHILFDVIKTKDPFIVSHSYNVAFLSNLMGLRLGLPADRLYRLYLASLLHDIGKIYVSGSILAKRGLLTEAERDEMKKHPIHSYNIIKDLTHQLKNLSGIKDIVLQHHEKYDGTGYPGGLQGEDIILESRILAVADAVDAMLSWRYYKKPLTVGDTIEELMSNMGKHFDPYLARVMVEILMERHTYQEVILREPIVMGTVELLTKEKSCQLQGTLIRMGTGYYRFKMDSDECLCEKCVAQLPDIINATFHVDNNGKIYEYGATIKYKDSNKIYISKLTAKPSCDYFSLLWALEGSITFKDSKSTEVIINKIGGDCLGFYINKNKYKSVKVLNNVTAATIFFEDGSVVRVTGKVSKTIKIGQKLYCEFKFLNILESTRDKIFRQIFQKQTRLSVNPLAPAVKK